jgi:prepilin-type N-terminal cleavage/methylation domain-containing protein
MLVTRSLTPQRAAPARQPRRGFTLGELVVALLLFSLVAGGILSVVMRQQRFYRSTADVIKQQGQLRQGASVLPLDLRMVSTSDTLVNSASTKYNADIYTKNDWSIEFRRIFGSSLICAKRTVMPKDTITIYPRTLTAIDAVSSWALPPVAGDSVLILDDWTMVGPGDDRWRAYEVLAVTPVTGINGCPWKGKTAGDNTPLLQLADTSRQSFKVALKIAATDSLSPTIIVGAPVRFFRRVRYEIYSAPDQLWYLGYSDCLRTYTTANQCSDVTPVAGPYAPYTGISSENGLVFAYYDSLGNALATTAQPRLISRVDVVMRSQTQNNVTRTGAGVGEIRRDSLVLSIGIRNRR